MRTILSASLLAGLFALPLSAQTAHPARFSAGPQVGAYVPAGNLRDDLSDALSLGAVARFDANDWVGITGSFTWAPTQATVPTLSAREEDLDLLQYDVGLEIRPFAGRGADWAAAPFLAAGVGARTYNFRGLNIDAQTDIAGFAAVGTDIALTNVSLRLEARGYLTDFDGYTGTMADSERRGDFTFRAGLLFHF